MTSGINNLRSRRKKRETVQPRHPAGGGTADALRDLDNAGLSLPAGSEASDPEPVVEPALPAAPELKSTPDPKVAARPAAPEPAPAASESIDPVAEDVDSGGDNSVDPEAEDEPANVNDDIGDDTAAADDDARDEAGQGRELPDLELDWTDPLNHIERNTRLSVPNSVVLRFKAVADMPGSAQYTEIMLEAVYNKLAELPELIVDRRPREQQVAGSFPFRRRSAPTPAANTDPKTALYMRPNNGEVELLGRIVKWANQHIKAGHPGRKDTDRSELITAALDATLPQLPAETPSIRRSAKPSVAS